MDEYACTTAAVGAQSVMDTSHHGGRHPGLALTAVHVFSLSCRHFHCMQGYGGTLTSNARARTGLLAAQAEHGNT